jgi:two-component system response regulator RegX3
MPRVLVIEDIPEMAELIRLYLEAEGLEVCTAESAERGLELLGGSAFDLIVLDLNLPGMDGFQFLKRFREGSLAPVIVVSARDEECDMLRGLEIGADEYVTKPFPPKVLAARILALLRRTGEFAAKGQPRVARIGEAFVDLDGRTIRRSGESLPLSALEHGLLCYLIERCPAPTPPEEIYRAVWKRDFGDVSAVAIYVQRLRRKLEADPAHPTLIETVQGAGYRLNPDALESAR